MGAFSNVFLQACIGEENAAVRNVLNIGDLSIVAGGIKGSNADSQNLSSLLTSDKLFYENSSNEIFDYR